MHLIFTMRFILERKKEKKALIEHYVDDANGIQVTIRIVALSRISQNLS